MRGNRCRLPSFADADFPIRTRREIQASLLLPPAGVRLLTKGTCVVSDEPVDSPLAIGRLHLCLTRKLILAARDRKTRGKYVPLKRKLSANEFLRFPVLHSAGIGQSRSRRPGVLIDLPEKEPLSTTCAPLRAPFLYFSVKWKKIGLEKEDVKADEKGRVSCLIRLWSPFRWGSRKQ